MPEWLHNLFTVAAVLTLAACGVVLTVGLASRAVALIARVRGVRPRVPDEYEDEAW